MASLIEQLRAVPPWEAIAVLLGLAYLLLAVRRSSWCWPAAFISTSIFLVLMAQAGLYMQTLLQVFYQVMAVYGYLEWRRGRDTTDELVIRHWTMATHLLVVGGVLVASVVNGWMLSRVEGAQAPYLDAFVTWGSVVTTWMVARRVIENWLYWVVVDGAAAWLYFTQGLEATSLLFVLYIGIVIRGYFVWRRTLRRQAPPDIRGAAAQGAGELRSP